MFGEGFLILLALLGVAIVVGVPIAVIVLLVQMSDVRDRLMRLEARVLVLAQARQQGEATITPASAQPLAPPPVAPTRVIAEQAGPWNSAGRTPDATTAAEDLPPPPPAPDQNRPIVLRAERFAALTTWLRDNWVYAIAALSLALAGVFFVQYGIERGLLPPPLRVAAGIGFGLALIAAGEWLRRRFGDDEDSSTAYLPSVFGGAGLVAIFAAVAAGRLMYGLYGPGLAFAGLLLTAAGAIVLGWRNGPLLVAVGLIGAAATPFLVGGGGAAPAWLYGHYLLVAGVGLAVDAWRRWAWISVLALVLGHLGLGAMMLSGAGHAGWLAALAALALLGIVVPERALIPRHAPPATALALWRRDGLWPGFAVRLAGGNLLAAMVQIPLVHMSGTESMLALALLAGLAVLLLIWAADAGGLDDLPLLPALAFLLVLALAGPLMVEWGRMAILRRPPETSAPWTLTILLGLATLISAAAAWRSLRNGTLAHGLGAVLVAPLAAGIFEALWQPSAVLGAFPWALHVMALAAAMVGLAVAFARADGGPARRTAWAVLAALSLIALALFILTSAAALTLALAVLLVVAVALDRRFDLPEMGWFVQIGAAVLSWRLLVDPGFIWADTAPLSAVILAYLGVAAACLISLRLLRPGRVLPRAVLESLGLSAPALLANVLLLRWLSGHPDAAGTWSTDFGSSHWGATLHALPWLVLAAVQLWRAGATPPGFVLRLRLGIAGVAAALAAVGLMMAVAVFNPLFAWSGDASGRILGPPLLDTLALAYALPGLLLVLLVPRLTVLPGRLQLVIRLIGAALLLLWAVLEIRRLWHGAWLGDDRVLQGELYSYTVAMLLAGAALMWQALARRSPQLQRIAMAVIGLTAAKVFLWDVSGLSGLVRVLSFAGLGLSLAGLAWLNRWAGQAIRDPAAQDDAPPPP